MKPNIIGVLFAAGVGLAVANPAEAQGASHEPDKGQLTTLSGNNGPERVLVMPALFIAGFAAGYVVRSLVSFGRHRKALRSTYGSLTSHRHFQVDKPHLLSVPREDVESPPRPSNTAIPP